MIPDHEGIELRDLRAAKHEALHGAREILADAIMLGATAVPDALLIIDEAGRTLHELLLIEVLPEPLKRK